MAELLLLGLGVAFAASVLDKKLNRRRNRLNDVYRRVRLARVSGRSRF